MKSICMYFQVHQPRRLRWFWPESEPGYFNDAANKEIFIKVARHCYWPATETVLSLIKRYKDRFRVTYSLSGTFLDQCKEYQPGLIDLFNMLADTGCVEFLDETYYHSLSSLFEDRSEFVEQVKMHREAMYDLFGYRPSSFRNTELIYSNGIAKEADRMGYRAILVEGIESIRGLKSPNYIYQAHDSDIRVLPRNYSLSDDISFRFSSREWDQYPLTADKWSKWAAGSRGDTMNIFMDYETFGEHQWEETGIFWFLKALPGEAFKRGMSFATVTETAKKFKPKSSIDVPDKRPVSWADLERDTSAWMGNDMQRRCFREAMLLGPYVKKTGDSELIRAWRNLLTSDHIYYICTKWLADGDVHSYFSHHSSPFDAGVNYAAVLYDFKSRVFNKLRSSGAKA